MAVNHSQASSKIDASPSSQFARRRTSLPSRGHASNLSTIDPASPEVISSLISSLSTISIPVRNHFESGPRIGSHTTPSSPALPQTELRSEQVRRRASDHTASSKGNGFGVSYVTYISAEEQLHSSLLHPDDAAISPVVRMARAPSSPRSRRTSGVVEPPSPRPNSRASYASSSRTAVDGAVFGNISAEPGPRLPTANSVASSSSGGRKSVRNSLGILKRRSREFGNDVMCPGRLRKTSSFNDSLLQNGSRSRASLRSMPSMAGLDEEGRPSSPTREQRTGDTSSTPITADRPIIQSAPKSPKHMPGGIGSGRLIPARESSLRHSFSSSSKKRKGARHSRYSSRGSRELAADAGPLEASVETKQVAQRILELKEKKRKFKMETGTDNNSPETGHEANDREYEPKQQDCPEADGEQSAPSPAVMTGKIRPRSVIATPSMPTSVEVVGQADRNRSRLSAEPLSPGQRKAHKRTPSMPISPGILPTSDERPSSSDSIDLAVFEYVSSPKLTQKVPHPTTGRMIAFSEVGNPHGHVVLCCLGMGLTRYLMAFYDELARTLNLRLVSLDRPGVGESEPYSDEQGNPLSWPDDVAIVCNYLKVTKFSILAHSAGAIYALATALRIPQHIRGRIHLLAPWIPPSQLSSIGTLKEPAPNNAVPYSQRILRALPTSFLKVANSSFMNATSASITTSLPKSPRRNRRKTVSNKETANQSNGPQSISSKAHPNGNDAADDQSAQPTMTSEQLNAQTSSRRQESNPNLHDDRERQIDYDNRLTHKIWELATTNANPAVDLLVCLERRRPIGFRYVDITRAVVIHHGARDTRVPVDNIRWLGKMMRRCEVRVLENEGHGLMASAAVMANVLTEIAKEWEDWTTVVQGKRRATINHSAKSTMSLKA